MIALSGGPDSIALASLLHSLNRGEQVGKLTVAHVNHQLRGAESDGDETFVAKLASHWQIPCRTTRIDMRAQTLGENLESAARTIRYDWLTKVAQEEHAAWIATGHTADDQAETMLFRLMRGSGLQGLGGIPARRELAPGLAVVRPLLGVRRAEVLRYLESEKLAYRADSSNEDLVFTRNRIRHELMPLLERSYNPGLVEVLGRLAEQARDLQDELSTKAIQVLSQLELPRAGQLLVLSAAKLAALTPFWRREVFRAIWTRECWPMGEMTFTDWQRLSHLADTSAGAIDLPGGIKARRAGKVIQLSLSSDL